MGRSRTLRPAPRSSTERDLVLDLPGHTLVNPTNVRDGHWSARARRAKADRDLVAATLLAVLRTRQTRRLLVPPSRPKRVRFEVWQARRFDSDAIPAACKSLRDGLQGVGVIDHDGPASGHVFEYTSEVGAPWVRIVVTLQTEES